MQITDSIREHDEDKQEMVLTLVASADEVDEAAKRFFADIQKREHKGFRKGKAPRSVLEQSVGGHAQAMGGVAEVLINEMAIPVIDESGVIFIEEPNFNVDATLEEGRPFTFTVSGAVAPLMKLADYGPVSIEMPPEEATDAEVDAHLRGLQDYYHSFENIDDDSHTAALGDYVMATLTVTNAEGKVIGGLSAASRMIGLGTGTMPATFDEQVVGAKAGDTLEFDFDATNPDGTSDFGEGKLHAVVDIKSFRREVLPPLDDELAAKVGCMDAEDMRAQMRRNINVQKQRELPKIKVDRVIEQIIQRLDGDVPDYYVDFIRQDVGREFMQDLEKKGTNLQQWMLQNSVEGDAMKDDISREALHRASIDCALEALFLEKGLQLTDEDIDKMFDNEDGEDTRQKWKDANRMADVQKMARQTKATEWLVDNADVTVVDYAAEAAK